jgi:hypothetical protein
MRLNHLLLLLLDCLQLQLPFPREGNRILLVQRLASLMLHMPAPKTNLQSPVLSLNP